MSNPKPTFFINASALKEAGCTAKFLFTVTEGLKLRAASSSKMEYGTAGHYFLADFYRGKDPKEAWATAKAHYEPFADDIRGNDFRSLSHLGQTCAAYAKQYKDDDAISVLTDDKGDPFIEKQFAYPWHTSDEFDIVLTGTVDLLASYHGADVIMDHKTTSAYPSGFFEKYEFEIQAMFYSWIMRRLYNMPAYLPFVINGLFLKKPTLSYFNKGGPFDGVVLQRSGLIEFPESKMEEFERWLREKLSSLILAIRMQLEDPGYAYSPEAQERSYCNAHFGRCSFQSICDAFPEYRGAVVSGDYIKEPYKPLEWH
jgi:hypothetical protein|tara:strand:- start:4017 stop:4955 length:939 start_codon:yes stop_codon:yes gene_type:complete